MDGEANHIRLITQLPNVTDQEIAGTELAN